MKHNILLLNSTSHFTLIQSSTRRAQLLTDFTLEGCASSKLHPHRKHRSSAPRRPSDEFPCSVLKIPCYIEKIPCCSKIIPCSLEYGISTKTPHTTSLILSQFNPS